MQFSAVFGGIGKAVGLLGDFLNQIPDMPPSTGYTGVNHNSILDWANSPWEPHWALEELDIVGFMIDSGLKLSHEQHEPDWQNCSLEHFALISAN